MAEQKGEEEYTNEEKLAFVRIPLRAQVLNVETQELINDVDRRSPINDTFNVEPLTTRAILYMLLLRKWLRSI